MSVYNDAATLSEAVASIRAQSFTDWELIIVNDGSTDGSWDILQRLAAEEPRIVLITQQNHGLTASLNRALSVARGEFIARQDADDRSSSERFFRQIAAMDDNDAVVLVGTGYQNIDEDGTPLSLSRVPATDHALRSALQRRNPIPHGSLFIRKSAIDKVGGYRVAFSAAQDYDLILRLAEVGKLAAIPEPLYILRLRRSSIGTSSENRQAYFAERARACADARQSGSTDDNILVGIHFDASGDTRPTYKYEYLKSLHLLKSGRRAEAREVLRSVPMFAFLYRPAFLALWLMTWRPGSLQKAAA